MNRPKPSVTYSALAPHRSEPCAVLPAQGAVRVSGVDLVGHRSPFRSVLSSPNEWQISHGAGKKGFYDTEHGVRSFFSLNAKEPPPGQLSYAGMSMISSSELSHYHYRTKKVLNHVDFRKRASNSSIPSRKRCFARSSEYPISSATHPQRVSLRFFPK